jgi:hypothetical protein
MGLLGRLFGGAPQQIEGDAVFFTELRDDARLEVLGEVHHEQAVRAFTRYSNSSPHKALLMPDPGNKYDSNAIAVRVWTSPSSISLVGYVAKELAPEYKPLLDYLAPRLITCDAVVAPGRGGRDTTGIALHLGTPGELIAELWSNDRPLRADHQWAGKIVAFSGEGLRLAGVRLDHGGQRLLARRAGCIAADRVTKKTDVCVATEPNSDTANIAKAMEYGVPVVRELDFWRELGIDAAALAVGQGRWSLSSRTGGLRR